MTPLPIADCQLVFGLWSLVLGLWSLVLVLGLGFRSWVLVFGLWCYEAAKVRSPKTKNPQSEAARGSGVPEGDEVNSRGQRPRNRAVISTRPWKGRRCLTLTGSVPLRDVFRGVAPGY